MRYITIALAKGRLAKKALEIFEHIGVTCDEMKDENTRKLIFTNEELGIRFFLAKPSDVPTYVEYGAADIRGLASGSGSACTNSGDSGNRTARKKRCCFFGRGKSGEGRCR